MSLDLSKKHNKRKQSTDIVSLFNETVRSENITLMKKFKSETNNEKEKEINQIYKPNREQLDVFNLNNDIYDDNKVDQTEKSVYSENN